VFVDKNTTAVNAQTQPSPPQDAWLTQALESQHHLGDALELRDAMWVGTHNSFNTVSNSPPSISNNDSNQHVSLVKQLEVGVRGIEVDVHWNPSLWANGAKAPVVCHARPTSEQNAGCTYERLLADELRPVGDWLRLNRRDVVLLYIEDALDDPAAFDAAATAIHDTIGDLVYSPPPRPPGGPPCALLPLDLKRAEVLAEGKQVVIMSGCGSAAWNATVFNDAVRAEEGNPKFDVKTCESGSVKLPAYGSTLVRFFEDSTFLSTAVAGGDPGYRMTVDGIGAMVRCGVNLFGLDQVDPSDQRLEAMVWSWAPKEPSSNAGMCATMDGADGRFHATSCGTALPYACVDGATWFVTTTTGPQGDGTTACSAEHPGSTFAVPGSGAHAQSLRKAKGGVSDVWLAFAHDAATSTWKGVGS
jgi:hypothetical protein